MYLREKDFFELFKTEKKHRPHLQLIIVDISADIKQPVYTIGFQMANGDTAFLKSARRERRRFKTIEAVENCIKRNLNELNFNDIRYANAA